MVMVWVGEAVSTAKAAELVNMMVESIGASSDSGFSNVRKIVIPQGYHNHEVYQVDGQGGKHYFYISKRSQDKVIWLTVAAADADSYLRTAINTF